MNTPQEKIIIPVQRGSAFLRCSQILYIENQHADLVEIITTTKSKIKPKEKLNDLFKRLEEIAPNNFIKIPGYIINSSYVQLVNSEQVVVRGNMVYQYYIIMENGDVININHSKSYNHILESLDKISF